MIQVIFALAAIGLFWVGLAYMVSKVLDLLYND